MKFIVEISADKGVLHRTVIEAMRPARAKAQAYFIFKRWQSRGANNVQIVNQRGETLYSWSAE
jgi:hypothetical protein